MSRLFLLHEGTSENTILRLRLLTDAAKKRGLQFHVLDAANANYMNPLKLNKGDLLFNIGRGAERLETCIMTPGVATFREPPLRFVRDCSDSTMYTVLHDRLGLPGPKTLHGLPQSNETLIDYARAVDGPPVVMKLCGGSLGVGVIFCPDLPSLLSIADVIRASGKGAIIREFIPHTEKLRLMVLGTEVLCSVSVPVKGNDFRTITTGECRLVADPSPAVVDLAKQAAAICEYEFCGVDIIDHPKRGPLLIEVNPPCNFTVTAQLGIDVAGALIDYLIAKAVRLSNVP